MRLYAPFMNSRSEDCRNLGFFENSKTREAATGTKGKAGKNIHCVYISIKNHRFRGLPQPEKGLIYK
jgi:hypothetical protein